ncbi:MAG: SAM hydroxide adenosyltransferase [bacterium]
MPSSKNSPGAPVEPCRTFYGPDLFGAEAVPGSVSTFVHGKPDEPFWYWGSGGTLEVALRDENAAARCGWRRGLAVTQATP